MLPTAWSLDDGDRVGHQLAQSNRFLSKGTPLGVRELDALVDLVPQDAVLLDPVFDSLEQRYLDPADGIGQHPLPWHPSPPRP